MRTELFSPQRARRTQSRFRKRTTMDETDFEGMTTNERLFAAGWLDDFERAAESRDFKRMVELHSRVGLASQAEWINETTLSDSAKYGF